MFASTHNSCVSKILPVTLFNSTFQNKSRFLTLKRVRNDKVEGADAEWQIEKAASSPLKRIRNDKVDGSGFGMTNRRSRFLTAEADSE
jgi:hypothetical protein